MKGHEMPWDIADNFSENSHIESKLLYGDNESADISLCIPVYGLGKYLKETLLNVKSINKYGINVQVIISDNKPNTDGHDIIELIKEVELQNTAYYLASDNLTQLGNFNRCIELAKTKYLCMLHDDDLLVDSYFLYVKYLLVFLKKRPDIGLIHESWLGFTDSPPPNHAIRSLNYSMSHTILLLLQEHRIQVYQVVA